jgi:hypothetical protein
MFTKVYLKQEESWCLNKDVIAIYNSFFSVQQEQEIIISPSKIIDNISRAQRSNTVNLIGGIRNKS